MSNLNENDIAVYLGDIIQIMDWRLDQESGYWLGLFDDGTVERDWRYVPVTDVPLNNLLCEYECLVNELSSKEISYFTKKETYNGYFTKKETYNALNEKIIQETDFKSLYGKDNAEVRKQHVKGELSDLYSELKDLEFSIDWIKYYIPFLREVIRSKRE